MKGLDTQANAASVTADHRHGCTSKTIVVYSALDTAKHHAHAMLAMLLQPHMFLLNKQEPCLPVLFTCKFRDVFGL